jgi:hypothetical protein
LRALKRLAHAYLAMSEKTITALLAAGELVEVKDGESKAS